MAKQKFARESFVITTEMVMPNETNPLNNLMGGHLMHSMDVAAALAAQRHSNRIVVTASVDNISFSRPIPLGAAVTYEAKVTRAFNSSMEVHIIVHAEDIPSGQRFKSNEAFFTFVAVDQTGRPIDVPELIPETEDEKNMYDYALRRRQLRLVLAGRLKPSDATELKSIFKLDE
ncbi:Acyl-CoA hydrolase [Flexibacter flexilis DSM 6793]|uniref:Acyl-CoA hydrolase n=1 Tax=Flexibacter flexilis DSM 6793 TaxID=927664 RepID=A0A1I1E9V1_9BACT|nr:acyl-CoA thioesterase [Flexibacter flexilis]SFB83496.1 Acyl-CoA hydrolase [Flexibacter flexilis DSM 6793]